MIAITLSMQVLFVLKPIVALLWEGRVPMVIEM